MSGGSSEQSKPTNIDTSLGIHLGILSLFFIISLILTIVFESEFRGLIKEQKWVLLIALGIGLFLLVFSSLILIVYISNRFLKSTKQKLEKEEKEGEIRVFGVSDEEVYYDLAKSRLDSTFREIDSIREFIGILVTANSIGAVLIGVIVRGKLFSLQFFFLVVAFVLILMSLSSLFCLLRRTNKYKTRSSEKIEKAYQSNKLNKEIAGEELLATAEYNEHLINKITSKLRIVNIATFGSLIILVGIVVSTLI